MKEEKTMPRLIVSNSVSLDGYFTDKNGDMSWAHKNDPEFNAFSSENAKGGGTLLFGRITYEMMASFWPSPAAKEQMPAVAVGMNNLPKVVFSRTLDEGVKNKLSLQRTRTRAFGNWNVFVCYEPAS
jgi:dihydrofolate reductase